MKLPSALKLLLMLLVLAALVSACGDDDDELQLSIDPSTSFPVTIEANNGLVEITQRPERIVSLSTVSTETLFEIGAGDQVIAVDDLSNFPADAPRTGLTSFTPNVEAIAEFEPDLVFISFDPGEVVASLEALGIPVILHGTANSLADAYVQIEQTGAATGRIAEAKALVASIGLEISTAIEATPSFDRSLTIYHEVSSDLYSSTSSTFIGQLYSLFGLENIADPADKSGFGFPQLSAEYILDADPDVIFLGDVLYGQDATAVAARPGWSALTAVKNGAIVELDTDIASRWGPRIPQLVESISEFLIEFWAERVS